MSAAPTIVATGTRVIDDAPDSRNHLLDGLRGIAALAVGVGHVGVFYNYPILQGSHLAVDFFFVLSGFVISKAYDRRLRTSMNFGRFIVTRIIRLYPLVILGTLLGLIKAIAAIRIHQASALNVRELAMAYPLGSLLIPVTFRWDLLFPLNGPLWSLFYEVLINLAYATLLFRMRRSGLYVLMTLASIVLIYAAVSSSQSLNLGPGPSGWPFGLARVTFGFCAGMIIARGAARGQRVRRNFSLLLPVVLLIFAFWPNGLWPGAGWRDGVFALLVGPAIIWIGAKIEVPRSWVNAFAYLGDLSYPFYAIHFPLVLMVCAAAGKLHLHPVIAGGLSIGVSVLAATVAERLYDQPVRARLSAMLRLRESARPRVLE